MFGTEDDDDFAPIASSKLASLFEKSSEMGNTSLTYTAPKQPKKGRSESQNPATHPYSQAAKLNIIIAKAVQTYKLEEGNYNAQGRLGAAVLGNHTTRVYQLLLYKNKQQHVTTTKITDKFQFTVQDNKFASFYDDQRQNWSINFDTNQDIMEFAKQVGLAVANAYGEQGPQPFYVQDLRTGEGISAELSDMLELRYAVNCLSGGSLGQQIESNKDADKPLRVKVRKGVWEEALVGATKGCKKLIVLAPVLFGPWKPQALPDTRLVVEAEIGRLKSARKSREGTPTMLPHFAESSESNVDSSTDETSIKARGASISEALTNSPKTHKASIISRMARMGQATLPLKGAVVCNPSDSEETEEETGSAVGASSVASKPVAKTRTSVLKPRNSSRPSGTQESSTSSPVTQSQPGSTPVAQQLTVFTPSAIPWQPQQQQQQPQTQQQYLMNGVGYAVPPQCHYTTIDGVVYQPPIASHQMFPAAAPVSTPVAAPDAHLAMIVSENRAQNTELRMGISKIIDKVDQVSMKMDGLQLQRTSTGGQLGIMDPMTLLTSIQKLVNDNELLQMELVDKRAKLEQQNEKMYHLLHANHKFLEQNSSMMEQRQDVPLQALVLSLQQEKAKLTADLTEAVSKASALQHQMNNFKQAGSEQSEEVKNMTTQLNQQHTQLEASKHRIIEQEKKIYALEENVKLSVQLHQSQEKVIEDLKSNVEELQTVKRHLEKSLADVNLQLEERSKASSTQMALLTASHKEELDKLQLLLRNLPSHDGDVNHQTASHLEEALKKQAQELTMKYKDTVDTLKSEKAKLEEKVAQLQEQIKLTVIQKPVVPVSNVEDVKKIMNIMYRLLKSEFEPEVSYDGSDIRQILLVTIKDVTLQYVNMKAAADMQPKAETRTTLAVDQATMKPAPAPHDASSVDNSSSEDIVVPSEKASSSTSAVERSGSPEAKQKSAEPEVPVPETKVEQPRDSSLERGWRPQPPPSPLFDEDDDDDDWLS